MMKIDTKSGCLQSVTCLASPNQDQRKPETKIDLIVVHCISLPPAEYGSDAIQQLFTNSLDPDDHPFFKKVAHIPVSAHVLIKRDGEIVQFVPFHQRAWHAGESSYHGREACNDFSIGIELEGTVDSVFEEIQYTILAQIILCLWQTYPDLGTKKQIVGHSDIAPERKLDPGIHFNWEKLNQLIGTLLIGEMA
jgi:N-acetyl-anhydromuramoyl-L-alanine amidase